MVDSCACLIECRRMSAYTFPGVELTFSYENKLYRHLSDTEYEELSILQQIKQDEKDLLYVGDQLGGCLDVRDCRCGYPFCCGDLATRFFNDALRSEDFYLFKVVKCYVHIMSSRVVELNMDYCAAFGDRALTLSPLSVEERSHLILARYSSEDHKKEADLAEATIAALNAASFPDVVQMICSDDEV